jgi:meso-butanediol dehydrogenase / (S,S)-butanediol dehydrogenase / diacetyl reductase
MERDFEGKIAFVTGTTGMGEGASLRLARGGASVFAVGIDEAGNRRLKDIGGQEGLPIEVAHADVSKAVDVERAVSEAVAWFGGIDVLVNCAGIQTYGTVVTTTEADWDRVFDVNVKSIYLTGHYAIPRIVERGGGTVVNIASVQGHACQRSVAGYAAGKAAIHALTRSMALDHAKDNIRVNSVSPGSIRTPMLEFAARELGGPGQGMEDKIAEFGSRHPLGRVGTIEDVAELIAFLAGPRSGFCTGADFRADGGLTAGLSV